MNVLHIGGCAGVTHQLVQYSNIYGYNSDYLVTHKANMYGHYDFSKEYSRLHLGVRSIILSQFYDVIILHENVKRLKMFSRLNKNIYLYAHGVELRDRYEQNKEILKYAKHIFVATPDLLDHIGNYNATYIPNPVPYYFNHFNFGLDSIIPKAFTFSYGANYEAKELSKKYNLELDIIERIISYKEIPYLMHQYTHYIDVKRWKNSQLLTSIDKNIFSMSGLEALACGLTVIMPDGIAKGLPKEHRIKYSGKLFIEVLEKYGLRKN